MSKDLYTKLLQIPDGPRPPHYYALLKLEPFESDLQLIHTSVMEKFAEVRKWQTAPDHETAQFALKLLEELSYAATSLELPDKKELYDRELARQLGIKLEGLDETAEKSTEDKPAFKPSLNTEQLEQAKLEAGSKLLARFSPESGFQEKRTQHSEGQEISLEFQNCPNCGAKMSLQAVLCIECGFDLETKTVSGTPPPAIKPSTGKEKTSHAPAPVSDLTSIFEKIGESAVRHPIVLGCCFLFIFIVMVFFSYIIISSRSTSSPEDMHIEKKNTEVAVPTPVPVPQPQKPKPSHAGIYGTCGLDNQVKFTFTLLTASGDEVKLEE